MKKTLRIFGALGLLGLMGSAQAHNMSTKGYEQLKADSKYFPHASSAKAKINKPVPNFAVQTLDGKGLTKASFKGKMGLFVLADTACPCVQANDARISALAKKYEKNGLKVIYVFSMPKERPLQISRFMQNHKLPYPAILDRDQRLLKMLDGRCSSEVYLMDKAGILRYHGRVDDSTFDPKKVKSRDLENAIVALTKGTKVAKNFAPAIGCAIPRI
jgi:peroxiredoxin